MREISIAFQTDKSPSDYIALAQLVDQFPFAAVSVYCDPPYHPSYGPLLLMAPYIRNARLGPAGVSPSRMTPIDMAAETALLAGVAAGGAYLGIVRGAWLADHGVQEVDKPITAIREAVQLVKKLLAGESAGFDGAVYKVAPYVRAPYPLPEKPIKIMIGTWGEKLCAVAGELADEVKIGGSANPDIVPVIQRYIAAGETAAGRAAGSVGVVVGAVCVADDDRVAAREMARRSVALYLPVCAPLDPTVQVEPELMARIEAHNQRGETEQAAALISDDLLARFAFAGDRDDLIQHAERLFEAGASRVEFGTPHGLRSPDVGIRILGEVAQALR